MRSAALSILFALFSCVSVMAQDDPEYRMEIGGGLGLMTYEGDFNGSILSGENMSPSVSMILRRVINPYSALRFSLGYGTVRGKSASVKTFYPDFNTDRYSESARDVYTFSNPLMHLDAVYEYNFFPYGTGRDYRGAKRLTPFVAIGLGFCYAHCKDGWTDLAYVDRPKEDNLFGEPVKSDSKGAFTATLPIGFGVKYKVAKRVNLAFEWFVHFSLSDKLDGVKDPYRLNSDGIFKNCDSYSNLQFTLTYSFSEKCKTCMNEDY